MARNSEKRNPFSGIIAGLALLAIGTVILWSNEGNYVANMKAVKDVSKNVIEISSESVDSANDGKLVCLNGELKVVDELVEDPVLGISKNTAKLSRIVEVYQWDETEHTEDKRTTYSYDKKWSEDLIDSTVFHESGHENPTSKLYNSEVFTANEVNVGAFKLSNSQLKNLSTNETIQFDSTYTLPEGYKNADTYITNSEDPSNPQVGDIRICFKYNNYKEATVLAVQQGNSFVDYTSGNGKSINRVNSGLLNSKQVVERMTAENNTLKWIMRVVGAVLIILGYISLISPISKLASFVPFLGNLVGSALSLIATLVGLIHSFIVVAIAWFVFRPLLSILLIAIAIGLVILIRKIINDKKEPASAQ